MGLVSRITLSSLRAWVEPLAQDCLPRPRALGISTWEAIWVRAPIRAQPITQNAPIETNGPTEAVRREKKVPKEIVVSMEHPRSVNL